MKHFEQASMDFDLKAWCYSNEEREREQMLWKQQPELSKCLCRRGAITG